MYYLIGFDNFIGVELNRYLNAYSKLWLDIENVCIITK